MRTYCIAQGTFLNALWWLEWEGSPKGRGYMYMASPALGAPFHSEVNEHNGTY